eukprot:TRINITY_DN1288_c3_g1_i1.p1 TRINITY_DN1288_c3_g1~~TRINITY_DN1288_c3_g1_i1.p1  ORF type:complete len:129 (+),score=2.06 TRINITY_DN1288_c3_g1_i1:225-611(+)
MFGTPRVLRACKKAKRNCYFYLFFFLFVFFTANQKLTKQRPKRVVHIWVLEGGKRKKNVKKNGEKSPLLPHHVVKYYPCLYWFLSRVGNRKIVKAKKEQKQVKKKKKRYPQNILSATIAKKFVLFFFF